ncbi:MAG TPA: sulfur carrier protein ThiS [Rudaea sp.]
MPTVVLNGQPRDVAPGATIVDLLADAGHAQRKVAVEINRQIVPKSQHASVELREGDRVEIVNAIGGG